MRGLRTGVALRGGGRGHSQVDAVEVVVGVQVAVGPVLASRSHERERMTSDVFVIRALGRHRATGVVGRSHRSNPVRVDQTSRARTRSSTRTGSVDDDARMAARLADKVAGLDGARRQVCDAVPGPVARRLEVSIRR